MSRTIYILACIGPLTFDNLVKQTEEALRHHAIIDEAKHIDEELTPLTYKELERIKYQEAYVELNRGSNSYDKPRNVQLTKQRVRSCRLYRRARDATGS